MGKRVRLLLILLSVSLNAAFIGVWAMRTLPRAVATPAPAACRSNDSCNVDCPLHRALGTTDEQWRTLEPLQREFRSASRASCAEIRRQRAAMLSFLAAAAVPRDSVLLCQQLILAEQRQMQELTVEHLLAEKQVLTAAQWRKLLDLIDSTGGCASHAGLTGGGQGGDNCRAHLQQTETPK
jgi:hypothetical protein